MGKRKINYDKLRVICHGEPSEEALENYYNLLIDYQIKIYGKEIVKKALEEVISRA